MAEGFPLKFQSGTWNAAKHLLLILLEVVCWRVSESAFALPPTLIKFPGGEKPLFGRNAGCSFKLFIFRGKEFKCDSI